MTRPDFNRVARLYAAAEYLSLGPLLQRTRTHFLAELSSRRHAVLFGDGDGRFLARLLSCNNRLRAIAVDSSATMISLLRDRCAFAADRLTLHHGDALSYKVPPGTDLIVTHFFLDCFSQADVDLFVRTTAAQLAPGALWLVSDFRVPAHGNRLWRTTARLYVRVLYAAFRVLTGLRVTSLPEPHTALSAAGLDCIATHTCLAGLLYTELWQLDRMPGSYNQNVNQPSTARATHFPDAQPDPEPAAPSLPSPDPGVFHHDPAPSAPEVTAPEKKDDPS